MPRTSSATFTSTSWENSPREGKKGGQYFTPKSIVSLIVALDEQNPPLPWPIVDAALVGSSIATMSETMDFGVKYWPPFFPFREGEFSQKYS